MDDESSGLFTITGLLVVLVLGAAVFWLLYTALAIPVPTANEILGTDGTPSPSPSPTPTQTAPPRATPTAAAAVTATARASPTAPATPTRPVSPSPTPVLYQVLTGARQLNVRQRPTDRSPVVEQLPNGSIVEYYGRQRRVQAEVWRQIRTPRGTTGWARAEDLAPLR